MMANSYFNMALAAADLSGSANIRERHTRTKDKEHNKYNEHEM